MRLAGLFGWRPPLGRLGSRRFFLLSLLSCSVVALGHGTAGATTIVPVAFGDMVRGSESIVLVRVVESTTSVVETPGTPGPRRAADSGANRAPLEGNPAAQPTARRGPPSPQSAGMKPGRVIFTHLTLAVEQSIKGDGHGSDAGELHLTLPGGTHQGRTLSIAGLPTFEVGERYLLFLSPGFERLGDPLIGVNQGFFRLVAGGDPATPVLVDHAGRFVVGANEDRVVVRDARESGPTGGKGHSSNPAPLTTDGMAALIRSVPGWDRVHPLRRAGLPSPSGGSER